MARALSLWPSFETPRFAWLLRMRAEALQQPGIAEITAQVLVSQLRAGQRIRSCRVLLGLDHDPARIAGKRAENRRIIDAAVARHGENARDHGIEEAQSLAPRVRHHAGAHVLGMHVADARAMAPREHG